MDRRLLSVLPGRSSEAESLERRLIERRRAARRAPAGDEPLSRLRLRGGGELLVVELSNSGALVEGAARLLPGTHVDVHLVTAEGRVLVRSRVVRAYVSHLKAEVILYRGAIAFERTVDTAAAGYAVPDVLAAAAASPGNDYPDRAGALVPEVDERRSA